MEELNLSFVFECEVRLETRTRGCKVVVTLAEFLATHTVVGMRHAGYFRAVQGHQRQLLLK